MASTPGAGTRRALSEALDAEADVLPEDVAEAVWFFASDASAKSTGNIINVDAGNAQAFTSLKRSENFSIS